MYCTEANPKGLPATTHISATCEIVAGCKLFWYFSYPTLSCWVNNHSPQPSSLSFHHNSFCNVNNWSDGQSFTENYVFCDYSCCERQTWFIKTYTYKQSTSRSTAMHIIVKLNACYFSILVWWWEKCSYFFFCWQMSCYTEHTHFMMVEQGCRN